MAYNQEYPYVDAQMFNIDWVLAKIKELEQAINVDAYKYIGENVYTDWNQAQPQTITYIPVGSLALNQAMEGASGLLFTNGNSENLEQRFYAFSSGDRWYRSARNGVWLMWSNKDDDSSYLKGLPQSSTFNANNAEPNTYLYAYGNPANFPSGVSAGMIVNYHTNDSGLLQIVYPTVGTDTWKRIKTSDGVFGQWMNVNDYSAFFKQQNNAIGIDANNCIDGGYYWALVANSTNLPTGISSQRVLLLVYHLSNTYVVQICIDFNNGYFWVRNSSGSWGGWYNVNRYYLKHYNNTDLNIDNIYSDNVFIIANLFTGDIPESGYGLLINYNNQPYTEHAMQIYYSLSYNNVYQRYKPESGLNWTSWVKIGQTITTLALLSSQHTDLYSTALSHKYNTVSTKETKGSSFLHADEGYKSFADAIMESDLSDKDMIVTNIEMWDMDTPVNELTAKVAEVVAHIKETSPLTEFTLYSLPPIDVPFFGDELYTYVWPCGYTLTEIDDSLLTLAEKIGFNYITWKEYKHINDNNLLSLYDDLFNNDLYQHSLQSYIETTI